MLPLGPPFGIFPGGGEGYPPGRGGGCRCIVTCELEGCELIVCVRTSFIGVGGGDTDEFMVWERPGGGAAPKIFEKAASRS